MKEYYNVNFKNECCKNHQLLLENIDILKKELRELESSYIENHARQVDENRKISRRVDELDNLLNDIASLIKAYSVGSTLK